MGIPQHLMRPTEAVVLEDSPAHRYSGQFEFLTRFPAYTVEHEDTSARLWYRVEHEARRLDMERRDWGLVVSGDPAVASRVFHRDAPPLPDAGWLPSEPPVHRQLHHRYAGIRPVLFVDPFEGMAWTILGQQITVALAACLKQAVARRYGLRVEGRSRLLHLFPGPAALARATVDDLRALQLSRQKAGTLIELARAIEDGRLKADDLYRTSSKAAREVLTGFRGIGPWTAEYILLRVYGHPDVLPAADVGLQRAWTRLGGAGGCAPEAAIREAGTAWSGYRSDFAFALWLDNLATRGAIRPS